jgi:hypothetical protein
MPWMLTLLMLILPGPGWTTVTAGSMDCPQQFEGRVLSIQDEGQTDAFFALDKVVLDNRQTLKGEVPDTVTIELVKGGPFELEVGKQYFIQMRSGRLCWAEEI